MEAKRSKTPMRTISSKKMLYAIFFNSSGPVVQVPCPSGDTVLFVCVEVLPQPNGVMSSAVSLPNHTFTGQA